MKTRWPLVLCAVVVLLISCLQHADVPLYDGVAFPDEAYRYVSPAPRGKATKLPATGDTETGAAVSGYTVDGIYLSSNEQGPQIYMSFAEHSFAVNQQTTTVTAYLTPLAGDGQQTALGKIAGNIYRITATGNSGPATFVNNKITPSYVDMRLPQNYVVGSTMIYRSSLSSTWQSLSTQRVGNDIYEAKAVNLGEYALTGKLGIVATPTHWQIIFLPLSVIGLFIIIIIITRHRSLKQKK